MFNVMFTFLPIIWFAVFDWEKDKEELLRNPKLYKIGLLDIYFNTYVFCRWFAYAFSQGTLLLLLTYHSMNFSTSESGKSGTLYISGQFIFSAVVILVNLKILVSSYQICFWNCFWIFGSIASFYIFFGILSAISASEMFGVF